MGNSSIFLVLGLVIMLGIFGAIMNKNSISATGNYTEYHSHIMARDANNSALQLAMRQLADSNKWRAGYSKLEIGGATVNLSVLDTTIGGKKAVALVSKSPYLTDARARTYDTLTSTVMIKINLIPPVVHAAWTAFGPLDNTISDMYIDGRDHNPVITDYNLPYQYELVPSNGYYAVSTGAPTFTNTQAGYLGGTNRNTDPYTDITPAYPQSAYVVETNSPWPNGFPTTPDAAMGWPEGTLESIAKSGVDGSHYIASKAELALLVKNKVSLSGVTYIDVSPADTFWRKIDIPDHSKGIFIFHGKTKEGNWSDISAKTNTNAVANTFQGIMIFDKIFHFHMSCVGAVVELTKNTEMSQNCNGNKDQTVAYSSSVIEELTGKYSSKSTAGWRSKLQVLSWLE
jgi:hypothetical protein